MSLCQIYVWAQVWYITPTTHSSMKRSATTTGTKSFAKRRRVAAPRSLVTNKSTIPRPLRSRVELKRIIADLQTTGTIPAAGKIFVLPRVAAGDGSDQRNGRAIQVKGYEVRSTWQNDPTQDSAPIRVIIFKWTEARTLPVPSDIIDSLLNPPYQGTYNVRHASNYTILSDQILNNDANFNLTADTFGSKVATVNSRKNISFTQTYGDNTLSSVQDTGLYMLAVPFFGNVGLFLSTAAVTFVDI